MGRSGVFEPTAGLRAQLQRLLKTAATSERKPDLALQDGGLSWDHLLAHDVNVRVVNATTGELLRELTIDQNRDYQPQNKRNP